MRVIKAPTTRKTSARLEAIPVARLPDGADVGELVALELVLDPVREAELAMAC